MCVERGEIKKSALKLYGLSEHATALPNLKTQEGLAEYGKWVIEGEKERIKQGGRPIYNPTMGWFPRITTSLWRPTNSKSRCKPEQIRP